ncbi:MAG: nucleotidyltransferase domain-containing protein [Thermoanaerobaculia bacterium]
MGIPSRLEPTAAADRRLAAADPRIVYLFGSRADGTANPDSDVDLGVLFSKNQVLAGAANTRKPTSTVRRAA